MPHNTLRTINARIAVLTAAVKQLGLTLPAAPDTSSAPAIPEVTATDIAQAVTKAKGDPAADKNVQRLVTARALRDLKLDVAFSAAQAEEHDAAIREAIPALIEQVRSIFRDAADTLEEHGQQFKAHDDLATLNLGKLPSHSAAAAQASLNACRTLDACVTAWKALGLYGQTGGHKTSWWHLAAPTQQQYETSLNATPQTFPAATAWACFAKGWALDLPESMHTAAERQATHRTKAQAAEDSARTHNKKAGLLGGGLVFL